MPEAGSTAPATDGRSVGTLDFRLRETLPSQPTTGRRRVRFLANRRPVLVTLARLGDTGPGGQARSVKVMMTGGLE